MNDPKKKILLVEDDAITALIEIKQLENYSYDVTHVFHAQEAIDLIVSAQKQFDLILIDIDLGDGLDGTQAAEEILKTIDLPIIFLSSHIEREAVEKTEKIISYGYVVKNTGIAVLDASIKMALRLVEKKKECKRIEEALQKRIVALTKPLNNSENINFEDMFNLSELQHLQNDFASATQVASIITKPDGTPITEPSNFCYLCKEIIRKTEKGLANCIKSDAFLGKPSLNGPSIQPCLSGGLWDAGAAINIGGKHVANWLIGQVRNSEQSEDKMRAYAKEIQADENEMIKAFQAVPAMSSEQFESVAKMLYTLATQLSDIAYQNIQQSRFITDLKRSEEELQARERRFSQLIQNTYDTIVIMDANGIQRYVSPSAEQVHGYTPEELVDIPVIDKMIHPEDQEKVLEAFKKIITTGSAGVQYRHRNKSGGWVYLEARGTNQLDNPDIQGIVINVRDITERKIAEEEKMNLQEQLHQSQKMDAIGQLAGGVAHDFNNALSGIIGAAELLNAGIGSEERKKEYIELILTASGRAAELTKKLLAFSRHDVKISTIVDVSAILSDTIVLLKHTIDKSIDISVVNKAVRSTVVGDDSLLQNALMNIGINASHAMPNGGNLTFTLENIEIDAEYCEFSPFDIRPGEYIEISIRDNGCGMPPEILTRIFEPFFTTKEQGMGTGLGMTAVYGTVKEHKGTITVYSEVGTGTVFHLCLPITNEIPRQEISKEPVPQGTGTILVIDDEKLIRLTASGLLNSMGYEVILAENGLEGVTLFKENAQQIDLIILDMIMPIMGGREAFVKLRNIRPDIPIIISSGFAKDEDMLELRKHGINGFLSKPFRKYELAEMLHQVLKKDTET